jgi:ABC-type uncharacterized transport system ATPase subunit
MTLELRNVSKRFLGVMAVDHVSFEARTGEITGYLGPNGSQLAVERDTGAVSREIADLIQS